MPGMMGKSWQKIDPPFSVQTSIEQKFVSIAACNSRSVIIYIVSPGRLLSLLHVVLSNGKTEKNKWRRKEEIALKWTMSELNLSLQHYLTVSLVGSSTAMDLYLPIAREYQVGDRLNFVIKLSKVVEFYTLVATVELSMKTRKHSMEFKQA